MKMNQNRISQDGYACVSEFALFIFCYTERGIMVRETVAHLYYVTHVIHWTYHTWGDTNKCFEIVHAALNNKKKKISHPTNLLIIC